MPSTTAPKRPEEREDRRPAADREERRSEQADPPVSKRPPGRLPKR
jgi:hypothetical protein